MENSEQNKEVIDKRKEKIKNWFKNPYNLAFAGIMIFTIILRLYYFDLTKNQPLWWDEADYMAYAKTLAGFPTNWIVTSLHNSLLPFIISIFFKLGFNEVLIKFLIELVPSILLVFIAYQVSSLLYHDKRVALISAFLMSVLWGLLFDNMRFHLETPALLFGFLAIYVFFKGYEKKEKIFGRIDSKWAMPLTVLLVVLTYSIRRGYFLFGLFFFIYILLTSNIRPLFKNKYNWIALAILLISVYFVESFIFFSPIGDVSGAYYNSKLPINLVPLKIFSTYFSNPYSSTLSILYYLFWIGLIILLFNLVVSFGHFKNAKNRESRSDLFVLIMLAVVLGFFIITRIRDGDAIGDPRWYYPLTLASFICLSKATLFIADYAKKYNKYLALILIVILIGYGGYYELKQADGLIKVKIPTYNGVKQASLFIKSVSGPEDAVFGKSGPQVSYYSERKFAEPDILFDPDPNKIFLDDFLAKLKTEEGKDIRYIIITISENGYPSWMKTVEYAQNQQGQVMLKKLEIPFMNTTIDFSTGKQDIKQSVKYGTIEFKLLKIVEDAFVYEIIRN